MELQNVIKRKEAKKPVSARIRLSTAKFIKDNKINLAFAIEQAIEEVKKNLKKTKEKRAKK